MRILPMLPSLLLTLAAACGDNKTGANPDGKPSADAAIDIDAAPDAPLDAAPPGMSMSRVWSIGDILVDNQPIAAGFTDGMGTFPFGPGNDPPINLANVRAFDAQGGKIAFVSDATVGGRLDLNVAAADGSGAIVVIQGGVANVDITSVFLSPDGTKVAFTMDSTALDGGFDLYMATTTAGATPVKLSPDRPATSPAPAAQDVFTIYTWSADSKYVAFSADLTEDTFDQAYVVDTTAATPVAVELLARADIGTQTGGAQGVRGALLFDNANNVYFRARTLAGNAQFQMFKATTAGVRTDFALPARADTTTPDAGAFAITADGTKMVFSADAPALGAYDLYLVTLANPVPAKLTTLTVPGHSNFTSAMEFSPDGTKIAVVADFLGGAGNNEPYVINLDGTTQTPRRMLDLTMTCPACTNVDAETVQWTADGTALYVRGDITTSNDTRVFRVDPTMTDQMPTLAVTTPTNGDISNLIVRKIP